MRTDVKIGIALGAVVLIIAGSYYGTRGQPGIELADSTAGVREQNARTLSELLSPSERSKPQREIAAVTPDVALNPQPAARKQPDARLPESSQPQPQSTLPNPALARRNFRQAKRLPTRPPRVETSNPLPSGAVTPALPAKTQAVEPESVASITGPPQMTRSNLARGGLAPASPRVVKTRPPRVTTPKRQARARQRTHVITPGDSFSKLAERYYGSQTYTALLIDANPSVDPRRMKVGSTVRIPPSTTTERPARDAIEQPSRVGGATYEVREGDSLYAIAETHLGSGARWPEVYELNKARIGTDPTQLNIGLVVKLPAR